MQKALKDDEELVVWFANAGEKLRVMEIFLPSPKVAVLSGHDAERNLTRVISPVDALQLVAKVMKVAAGSEARCGWAWSCRRRKIPTGDDPRFAFVAQGGNGRPCRGRRGGRLRAAGPASARSGCAGCGRGRRARHRLRRRSARAITLSARAATWAAVSPFGTPSVHRRPARALRPGSAGWCGPRNRRSPTRGGRGR